MITVVEFLLFTATAIVLIGAGTYGINEVIRCSPPDAKTMDFKSFMALYNVAPHNWRLEDNYVTYKKESSTWVDATVFYSETVKQNYRFALFDHIRYKAWLRSKKRR